MHFASVFMHFTYLTHICMRAVFTHVTVLFWFKFFTLFLECIIEFRNGEVQYILVSTMQGGSVV